MKRFLGFACAMFFALVAIALVGGDAGAVAGHGCHGARRCHGGLFARHHRCHGERGHGLLGKHRRCHGAAAAAAEPVACESACGAAAGDCGSCGEGAVVEGDCGSCGEGAVVEGGCAGGACGGEGVISEGVPTEAAPAAPAAPEAPAAPAKT